MPIFKKEVILWQNANMNLSEKPAACTVKQRRLEREIRYSKQKAAMMEAAGDKEGFEQEALKIKEKQSAYNAFCKKTGRTKRLDRTQIFEYNKGVSGKANVAVKSISSADGIPVKKTKHSIEQAEKRSVTDTQIKDALKNPLWITEIKYDVQGRPSKKYIGEKATVAVNPDNGNIVTVHRTHSKLAKKLKGGKDNEV